MFKGSLPAMVTPFDNGEVDVKGLKNLVNWHIEQEVMDLYLSAQLVRAQL